MARQLWRNYGMNIPPIPKLEKYPMHRQLHSDSSIMGNMNYKPKMSYPETMIDFWSSQDTINKQQAALTILATLTPSRIMWYQIDPKDMFITILKGTNKVQLLNAAWKDPCFKEKSKDENVTREKHLSLTSAVSMGPDMPFKPVFGSFFPENPKEPTLSSLSSVRNIRSIHEPSIIKEESQQPPESTSNQSAQEEEPNLEGNAVVRTQPEIADKQRRTSWHSAKDYISPDDLRTVKQDKEEEGLEDDRVKGVSVESMENKVEKDREEEEVITVPLVTMAHQALLVKRLAVGTCGIVSGLKGEPQKPTHTLTQLHKLQSPLNFYRKVIHWRDATFKADLSYNTQGTLILTETEAIHAETLASTDLACSLHNLPPSTHARELRGSKLGFYLLSRHTELSVLAYVIQDFFLGFTEASRRHGNKYDASQLASVLSTLSVIAIFKVLSSSRERACKLEPKALGIGFGLLIMHARQAAVATPGPWDLWEGMD
ncbi:uncharacterized protein EV420DRAFT_1484324 [Desarmillaria tabescens]|uniref:Uncharacterized protein n=1 Tax=Armillaria tabescens TaxID=1929756 RepID=A0AA39JMA4_ARMTA|nr:uncharacterized protein EV420DRAFT_1484324 [Desarmillaria tabescens]KAK0445268.1 hypothetical protein EV420DRAFT_1484324 [Desarmillaria tabescens]